MDEGRSGFLWTVAGAATAAGSAAALAAWLGASAWLPARALQDVRPEAAIGLAGCGIGVVLAAVRRAPRHAAELLGWLVGLLAAAAIARDALGTGPGFQAVLGTAARTLGAPAPEPMEPNAAIGLALAGAALATGRRAPMLRWVLGACCAALGASALLGHVTGVHSAYGWGVSGFGASTRMSPLTAAGLAVLGLALGLLHPPGTASPSLRNWRGPLLAGLSSAVATVLFSQALSMQQELQLRRAIDAGASRLRAEVRDRLHERMEALELLANIWKGRVFPDREAWESDAELIMSQSPGLEGIEWIEPSGASSWVVPAELALPPPDASVLEARRGRAGAMVLGPLRLDGGRPGLRILAPLHVGRTGSGWLSGLLGDWDGWLAGVFDAHDLLSDLVAPLGPEYEIRIASGDLVFYESEGAKVEPGSRWTEEIALEFPGSMHLSAWVGPSTGLLHAQQSPLPSVLLAGGLLLSGLLALGLGLANVSRDRALQLEDEVGERLRAEEQVRRLNADLEARVRWRTTELSRSNEDLRRFAAFLSHELRQPVATQAVWVDLLETRYARRLDEEGRRYLARLRSFTSQIAEAIEAQLALFSVTGAPLCLERVELGALLEGLLAELKERLESHRARVCIEDLPPVHGDARLLRQLLRNLLENAINYRRPEVPLRIRIRPGTGAPGADLTEIVVEDNGRGIAPEDAERIFEPGGRVGPDREGNGLGLTVCRRIAERHGGSLHAEGRPEAGAAFRLVLPIARDESPGAG